MKRVAVALFASALVFAVASAAPIPKHANQRQPLYFPTTVGTRWVYEDAVEQMTLLITKVEESEHGKLVVVAQVIKGVRFEEERMLVSTSGLIRVEGFGQKLDSPQVMLKVPCKPGDTWARADPEGTSTIRAVEEVKVPAGTYEAVRVDFDYTLNGQKRQTSFWYAADVGLVKMTYDEDKTLVLKKFIRGTE